MKKHTCFTVLGERFFSIGAQLHNSTGYALGADAGDGYRVDRDRAFRSVKALGANTVAVPVCWDVFEPEEEIKNLKKSKKTIDKSGYNAYNSLCVVKQNFIKKSKNSGEILKRLKRRPC